MSELEITKELIAHIFEASGKSSGDFSKDIGVTTKALRMYLDGIYKPRKAYTVARLKKLANTYGVGSFPDNEVSPVEFPSAANIKQLREASGLTIEQFAAQFGLTKSTYSNYEYGAAPDDVQVRANISAAWQDYVAKQGAPAQLVPSTDAEFAPEVLKAFQKRLGLSVKEVANLVGVTSDAWYKWTKGECYPNRAKNVKALRKALAKNKPKGKPGPKPGRKSNLPEAAMVKGGKHQLSVVTAHEIANEFHARYQPRLDEAAVDYTITLVCEKHDIERSKLRRVVASVLLLLKDRMSPQELYESFSGHSS